jgi:DNA-binding CsgD family transcriptional regulator
LTPRGARRYCLALMDNFEKIKQLRDEHESALDEAARLRDAYHREIVKLHRSGLSLREIADELGISHQRVHQIVAPHEDVPRAKSKRGVAAGAIVAAVLLAGALTLLAHRSAGLSSALVRPVASPPPVRCVKVSSNGHLSAFSPRDLPAGCDGARGSVVSIDNKTGKIVKRRPARRDRVVTPPPPPPYLPCAVPC